MFPINLFNSSSFLIANKICLGTILFFLLSLAALPANSKTYAAKYSNTAAKYTGAPAPTLYAYFPFFKNLAILPTGNCNPAFADLDTAFAACFPLPPFPFPVLDIINIFSFFFGYILIF